MRYTKASPETEITRSEEQSLQPALLVRRANRIWRSSRTCKNRIPQIPRPESWIHGALTTTTSPLERTIRRLTCGARVRPHQRARKILTRICSSRTGKTRDSSTSREMTARRIGLLRVRVHHDHHAPVRLLPLN